MARTRGQDRRGGAGAGKSEPRGVEVRTPGPKSISEKGSEEDEEEKLEDDKSGRVFPA